MAIQNIFVVGAGLMGSGIAQTAMTSGYHVILNDQRQETLERAQMGIESRLKHMVEKGTMSEEEFQDCMGRLKIDTRLSAAREADLVVEAIFENLEAKQAVFRQLEEICPDHTIFASNTSSISLTALAAATKRPSRVVGMHFFSPVPKMKLCEVIFGLLTAQDVLEDIKEVGEKMGKTLILADDKPGFIVNRALLPMLNEACVIVGSFIGSVETTSLAAAATFPLRNASARSFSTIRGPRLVLMRITPSFIFAMVSLLLIPLVSGKSGQCREITSDCCNNSSKVT